VLLGLAPFSWTVVVPGTGRYAYLAALGAAWLVIEAVRQLVPAGRARLALGLAAALLGATLVPILLPVRRAYVLAGELAEAGRRGLAELARARRAGFCAGYPPSSVTRDAAGRPSSPRPVDWRGHLRAASGLRATEGAVCSTCWPWRSRLAALACLAWLERERLGRAARKTAAARSTGRRDGRRI
jgi:hypothetical protein